MLDVPSRTQKSQSTEQLSTRAGDRVIVKVLDIAIGHEDVTRTHYIDFAHLFCIVFSLS